jgi:FHS family L-fucose permease-like MFS transporter
MGLWSRKITVNDDTLTSAAHLTLRQSMIPNLLGMAIFLRETKMT